MNYTFKEQETHIYIDYYKKEVIIYTNRKRVYQRIKRKIGEANNIDNTNEVFYSATWTIPLIEHKKITKVLSRITLVGSIE